MTHRYLLSVRIAASAPRLTAHHLISLISFMMLSVELAEDVVLASFVSVCAVLFICFIVLGRGDRGGRNTIDLP